jgi:hypothetical protein
MPHPIAVRCLANTIAAARKSREMDDRLAASDADDIDRLAKSREAVAESEHLLARLKRDGRTAAGRHECPKRLLPKN